MDISIKTFGYAVKFDVRKKKEKNLWVLSKCSFFGTVELKKKSGAPQ